MSSLGFLSASESLWSSLSLNPLGVLTSTCHPGNKDQKRVHSEGLGSLPEALLKVGGWCPTMLGTLTPCPWLSRGAR